MLHRVPVLLLVTLVGLGTGASTCIEPPPGTATPESETCFENSRGDCVVASLGCAAEDIISAGNETCATCALDGEDLEICGVRELATCFPVEGPNGDCTVCETPSGDRVFSDCLDATDIRGDLECSVVPREQPGGDVLDCELCRDNSGRLVSEVCRPEQFNDCALSPVDELGCQECRNAEDALVYRECAPAVIEPPRICQVYQDEDGRCVDCFGEDDQLVLHECTVGPPGDALCETFIIGGERCLRCTDERGEVVSEECQAVDNVFRCERVDSPFESCIVCLDDSGQEARSVCTPNECVPGRPCGSCEAFQQADGTPCRLCTSDDGATERFCAVGGETRCFTEESAGEPAPDDPNAPPAALALCTVCTDADGAELHRECTGAPPPVCESRADPVNGDACDVCFDETSNTEFSTCPNSAVGFCAETSGLAVTNRNNEPLTIQDVEGRIEAVVDCNTCEGGYGICETRTSCEPGTPPGECIGSMSVLQRDATAYRNPWDPLVSAEDIANMMGLLMAETDADVYSAEHFTNNAECPADDCSCATGTITIVVPQANAPRFVNGFDFSF